eukprot:gene10995-12807_t
MADESGSLLSLHKLCVALESESSHTGKSALVAKFCDGFTGDLYLLAKLMLVKEDKRVFRIKDKQMLKILAEILNAPLDEMIEDLDHGDVTETAKKFYREYGKNIPDKSSLTLLQVDTFLNALTEVSKFDDQVKVISKFLKRCTPADWRLVCRIIDSDLKVNLGAKYFLEALHPDAHLAYKKANNLKSVIDTIVKSGSNKIKDGGKTLSLNINMSIMTPIKPMLPKALKSVDEVVKACSNLFFAEIKYDGERIQIHKKGNSYQCFSRNLKPIMPWKVEQVKPYIPQATDADSIILDGEILLMDVATNQPLPFGTLSMHKKKGFADATVCVFLFDILYLNGKSLLDLTIVERRKILEENVTVVRNRVELGEITRIAGAPEKYKLTALLNRAFAEKLEGLVIKDGGTKYMPGMRHWIKIKKDYLKGLADSADLLALGGYYGTGSSGGLVTVFLMCTYDEDTDTYKTVCKVSGGLDDKKIAMLQPKVMKSMTKISKDVNKIPKWLDCLKIYAPDFIINDPKKAMVFEIESAELTGTKHHSSGYSMRFPRIVRIRDDKDWATSTTFAELKHLAKDIKIVTYDSDDEEKNDKNQTILHHKKQKTSNTTSTTTTTTTASANKSSTTSNANNPKLAGKINYVINGDDSGKWRGSGVSGAIGSKWKKAEEEFNAEPLEAGDIRLTKVEDGQKKIHVCNVSCIKPPTKKGESYSFNITAFGEAMANMASVAKHKKASVHAVKPNYPGLNWRTLEDILVEKVHDKGVQVFVHEHQSASKPTTISSAASDTTTTTKTTSKNHKKRTIEDADDEGEAEDSRPPMFRNVKAVISVSSNAETKRLANIIKQNGGEVSTNWITFGSQKTTHLICNAIGDMYTHVDRLGGLIVTPDWVDASVDDGFIAEEEGYIFHDKDNPDYNKSDDKKPDRVMLPEVFTGCRIFLTPTVNDRETLSRYIIAYNGEVCSSITDSPTHVSTAATSKAKDTLRGLQKEAGSQAQIVTPLWIYDCINSATLIDTADYKIKSV